MSNEKTTPLFEFSIEFQIKIIVAIIQDEDFMIKIGTNISPFYFENRNLTVIFGTIKKYFNKYATIPDKIDFMEFISDKYKTNDIIEDVENIYDYRKLTKSELDFILDKVKEFVGHQELKKAIVESVELLEDNNNFPTILEKVQNAIAISEGVDDLGYNAYEIESINERSRERVNAKEKIFSPIGFKELDNYLNGGIIQGELFTFLGPAKSGKSQFLVNVGTNFLLRKKNVLYFTLEMSESATVMRFDQRLLGMTENELHAKDNTSKLKEILNQHIGRLHIKAYPSEKASVDDLINYTKKIEKRIDFVPDIIIIDYGELLRPTRNYAQRRFELGNIYRGIKSIGNIFDVPIVTATQSTRESMKKVEEGGFIDMTDVAEAFEIIRIISYAASINTSYADKRAGKCNLFVCANRFGEDGGVIPLHINYHRCLVKDW